MRIISEIGTRAKSGFLHSSLSAEWLQSSMGKGRGEFFPKNKNPLLSEEIWIFQPIIKKFNQSWWGFWDISRKKKR
jgi:hypothetical protein